MKGSVATLMILGAVAISAVGGAAAQDGDEGSANISQVGSVLSCTGAVGAITVTQDLIVSDGARCALNGTTVLGNVEVRAERQFTELVAVDSAVTGDVRCVGERSQCILERTSVKNMIAVQGGSAAATPATILGDARCTNCILFELAFASVAGDVVSRGQLDGLSVVGSTVGGSVYFQFSPTATFIFENTIGENLEVSHNSGNAGLAISSNRVGGNIRLVENSVTVILLQDNTAAGKIRCVATSPTPTASGNTGSSIDAACGQS